MDEEYEGYMILIDRLSGFHTINNFSWNGKMISLDDITDSFNDNHQEETEPFGNAWSNEYKYIESRTRDWHLRRVLYFVNHPNEIRDILLDNLCYNGRIFPLPIIMDGNHRFMAARWLYTQGEMDKVECEYSGRQDLLRYLQGETDNRPEE